MSNQEKKQQKNSKYDRKKTMNEVYKHRIVEEDCSPLKDKTTFNTPSDMASVIDYKMKRVSDNTMEDINDKITLKEASNSNLEKRSHKTQKSNKRNSDVSKGAYQFGDLKITDETNSKNMSVSDNTVEEDHKRKSFISTKSRTNSFILGKKS